jgi:hypothetical protein
MVLSLLIPATRPTSSSYPFAAKSDEDAASGER